MPVSRNNGSKPILNKISVRNRLVGLLQNMPQGKLDRLEIGLQ